MTARVLTFFNNKAGVGTTSLVYHVAWMMSELDLPVLVVDLDPQASLTAAFLDESALEELWDEQDSSSARTIHQCVEPLTRAGDIREPRVHRCSDGLHVLPGDLALSGIEDFLSTEWLSCPSTRDLSRSFRVMTAFWHVMQAGARKCGAERVAGRRRSRPGSDQSLRLDRDGLRRGAARGRSVIAEGFAEPRTGPSRLAAGGLGAARAARWTEPEFDLPPGTMHPLGYVIQQHGVRLSRPIEARDRWVKSMPARVLPQCPGSGASAGTSRSPKPTPIASRDGEALPKSDSTRPGCPQADVCPLGGGRGPSAVTRRRPAMHSMTSGGS